MEKMKNFKKVDFNLQFRIVEEFLVGNINASFDDQADIKLNYKMNSLTWAQTISNWIGAEISVKAVNAVFDNYRIEKLHVYEDIFVYAAKLI